MTVPGRVEAAALLLSLDPPPWFLHHVRAVAEVAGWLALRAVAAGRRVDRRLVESAALLHDIDKIVGSADAGGEPHGNGSAFWLTARGHAELAPVVAGHPVTRLVDAADFAAWSVAASDEGRIVAYADKRAGQRLETLDERFASWARRYPPREDGSGWDGATIVAVRARAVRLEADVCALAGTSPSAVERLRWTGPAFRAAHRSAAAPDRGHRA